jgi:hypothetical protein
MANVMGLPEEGQCQARVNIGTFKKPAYRQCLAAALEGGLCPIHKKKLAYGKITEPNPGHFMHKRAAPEADGNIKKHKKCSGAAASAHAPAEGEEVQHQGQTHEDPPDCPTDGPKDYWSSFRVQGCATKPPSAGSSKGPPKRQSLMVEYASAASTSKDIPKHPDMEVPNVEHEGAGDEEAEHEGVQDPDAGSVEGEHREEDEGHAKMPDINDGMGEEEQEDMMHGAIGPDDGDVAPMHDYEAKKAATTKRVQEWRQRKRAEAKAIELQELCAAHGMEQAQAILNKRASTAARVRACRARKA